MARRPLAKAFGVAIPLRRTHSVKVRGRVKQIYAALRSQLSTIGSLPTELNFC